jgi:hypothetical protein
MVAALERVARIGSGPFVRLVGPNREMPSVRRCARNVYPDGWDGWRGARFARGMIGVFLTRWMTRIAVFAASGCCAAALYAQADQPTAAEKKSATTIVLPPSPKALLPNAFDGWDTSEPSKVLADATQADAANAAALKEYGYVTGLEARYKREGEKLSLRALKFDDASGAYGAYTFYRQNGWPKETVGAGAASDHSRVLFWQGTTVVDANFSRIGPMSAGELREIARQLPEPGGNRAMAPPILASLPQHLLDPETTHYAVGPAGYEGAGGVLPPALVGFEKGAEAVTANYSLTSNPATLTIIDYPTPQMAQAQESAIRAYLKAGSQAQPPWPKPLTDSDLASLEVRRSGPLVAVVSGDAIPDESHRLIESVHYEADLTAIPQPVESEVEKTSKLLMGIAVLCLVGGGAAVILGGFFGGGRALYRMARGKPASSVFDEEFIHLDLREEWVEVRDRPGQRGGAMPGPHPKG